MNWIRDMGGSTASGEVSRHHGDFECGRRDDVN